MLSPDSHHAIKSLTPPEIPELEQIADAFITQIRSGYNPEISEYVERYPALAKEIEEVFPAIAALEAGKNVDHSSGKVSLGERTPEQLGDFKIIREIGRGGMGVVYEAIQESLNRRVALKLLPRHSLLGEKQLKRFRREAELTASLHHTNIVPVFGVGENEGFHYYVMQLIEGVGLDELAQQFVVTDADSSSNRPTGGNDTIVRPDSDPSGSTTGSSYAKSTHKPENKGVLRTDFEKYVDSPEKIAILGVQAANALQYAHDRGILHRDIKPGNLLLDRDGLLCITDFGLARAAEQSDLSKSTDVVGTLGYMAPEMFREETCSQSDIYGLGITLYELLTKRSAIVRTNRHEMISQITQGSITPLRRINSKLSRDLETIVLKAIAPGVNHRYQKASDLADDLNRFLENCPIRARRITPFERLWRWSRRNPAIATLSSIAMILVMLLGAIMAVGFERERQQRKRIESSSQLAVDALDRVFDRFVPSRADLSDKTNSTVDYTEPVLSRESADLLAGMVQYYEQLAKSTGSQREFQIKAANAQHKVGDIHRRLGDYHSALDAYQKSLDLYLKNPDKANVLITATVYNEIGRIHRYLRQQQEANNSYQRAIQLLQKSLEKNPKQPSLRFELARTYYLMVRKLRLEQMQVGENSPAPLLSPANGVLQQAEILQLNQAIEILDQLTRSAKPLPEYRYLLALCLQEQVSESIPLSPEDNLKQERVHQILESLVDEQPAVADYRQALVKSYEGIDMRNVMPGAIDEALIKRFDKAIHHATQLVSDYPTIPEYKISLIHAHNKMAHALDILAKRNGSSNESRQQHETAELSLRTALRLQKELVIQFPQSPEMKKWLAKIQVSLAMVLDKKGNDTEATSLLESAILLLETELKTHSHSAFLYDELLHAIDELARIYEHSNDDVGNWLMSEKFDQYENQVQQLRPGYIYRRSENRNQPPRNRQRPPRGMQPPPRNGDRPPDNRQFFPPRKRRPE
ncbi:MAG: protein kinase [Planctomycetes bacterium]|nr:protein kinase [Planctomycetota bacterium]MCH9776269.1 protein kinase [Planctomycetota bacterium]MCH9793532.1 protein kinase [Planctomycetota bacterium]